MQGDRQQTIASALALHALSGDASRPAHERAAALQRSSSLLREACSGGAAPIHLPSLARVARDAGERSLAVAALESLISALPWMGEADLGEPFLAPWPRFSTLGLGGEPLDWLMAAAIEAHECLRTYTSYLSGPLLRDPLDDVLSLGFGSEALERRRQLIDSRFNLSQASERQGLNELH